MSLNYLGRVATGSQFVFWLFVTLAQGLSMGSVIMGGEASLIPQSHNTTEVVISAFLFTLCFLNLVTHCFADKTPIYTEIRGKNKSRLCMF